MTHGGGYFDLQINGYAGVDFNADHLTPEQLHHVCEALLVDGVTDILATIITEDVDKMAARLSRIVALRESDAMVRKVIRGFHIEGPFINASPGFVGAHPADAARDGDTGVMQRLLDAAEGLTRIVTLAPEVRGAAVVTRHLADAGVIVAAGHTDASLVQLRRVMDAGLSMVTHLGNGCPMRMDRHDNILQRVLHLAREGELWVSFIADGMHVPWFALSNYMSCVPADRTEIVSDAMAAAGSAVGGGTFTLGRMVVTVNGEAAATNHDASHLAGSATTLGDMADMLRHRMKLTEQQITQIMVTNPRRLLGMERPAVASPSVALPEHRS